MSYKPMTEVDSLMSSLYGYADGRSDWRGDAKGNEVDAGYRLDDSGASMVPDPVEKLWRAGSLNRFDTPQETPIRKSAGDSWDEPLNPEPAKSGKAVRFEVVTDAMGRISKGYSASGELVSYRWLGNE